MTDPIPEGTRAIVDQAVEEAAQSLFSVADVPLARADELLAALQGRAVRDVLQLRIEQMTKHGHDLLGDAQLPLGWLPNDARLRVTAALDLINGGPDRRNLPVARRRIATAAAILLAAIDVLDVVIEQEGGVAA